MDELIFRCATEYDFPAIVAVALKSFMLAYATIFEPKKIEALIEESYTPEVLRRFLEQTRTGGTFFEVAATRDRSVGFCVIGMGRAASRRTLRHPFYGPLEAILYRLYVDPEYTGKGVGHGLLRRGERFIEQHGIARYSCFVHARNEIGKAFYLRQGFEHVQAKDRLEDWCMEKALGGRAAGEHSLVGRSSGR